MIAVPFQHTNIRKFDMFFVFFSKEDYNPLAAYELLKRIRPVDRELLGLVRPEQLIIFAVPVPPVCIRPTVSMGDKGTREDDLTVAIGESLGWETVFFFF